MPDPGPPPEASPSRTFRSPTEEAREAILRTADLLRRRLRTVVAPRGITTQQYSVLRILRGTHPGPLPTLEIGERMIDCTPGITRLLDGLENKGLVRRERSSEDRRMVLCWIGQAGLALLAGLDGAVEEADHQLLAGLQKEESRQLVDLLERIRSAP